LTLLILQFGKGRALQFISCHRDNAGRNRSRQTGSARLQEADSPQMFDVRVSAVGGDCGPIQTVKAA